MARSHFRALVGALTLCGLTALPATAAMLRTVALSGDVAPGTGGAVFSGLVPPVLSSNGSVGFGAVLSGSGVIPQFNDLGFFTPTEILVRRGDGVPEVPGGMFANFGPVQFNDAGEIAFGAPLTGLAGPLSSLEPGIFTSSALIAQQGEPAPGTAGARFGTFGLLSLNAAGEVAFRAFLEGGDVTPGTASGIFTDTGLVVRAGDTAPDTGGAAFEGFFGQPSLNDAGEIAFRDSLVGGGVTRADDAGIFTLAGPVVREGEAAPGTAGAVFDFFGQPILNDTGEVLFFAGLRGSDVTGANSSGLFTTSALVAREGDVAPGTGGALFDQFDVFFGAPDLNDGGDAAFLAMLAGPGVTPATDRGLFFGDGLGGLSMLVREGDVLDVGGGDLRTINTLSFLNGLSDTGDVGFQATFTDGSSGVFVLEAAASAPVPLPASGWLLLAGLGAFGVLRRKA